MTKSLGLSAALLSLVLLIGAASVSARAGGPFVSASATSVSQSNVVNLFAHPAQTLSILANPIFMDNGDNDHRYDPDNDGDRDHHDHDKAPSPTPEPSTLLSFGAALLIGGGVLFSRRLRRSGK